MSHLIALGPEQKIVVDHSNTVFATALEGVFDTLAQLGLTLEALAQLNTQSAMLLPVKHVDHYKGGHYVVLGEGIHTETQEPLMLYYHPTTQKYYARPLAMFNGMVTDVADPVARFKHKVVKRLVDESR